MENNKFYDILVQIRNLMLTKKEILTIDEVALYTGYEKSYLYKLTSMNKIPYYKPGGKNIFFKLDEINKWLTLNPVKTRIQIDEEVYNKIINIKIKKYEKSN